MSEFFAMMSDVFLRLLSWLEEFEFAGFSALHWAFFCFAGFAFLRFILWPALGGRIGFGQGSSDSVKDVNGTGDSYTDYLMNLKRNNQR